MADYPNSGTLFARDKRSGKAPDYGGDFTISDDVLDYVIRKRERGETVKLELSGWKRQGRNNTVFISLSIQTPYTERQQGTAPRQQSFGGGGYDRRPQQNSQYDRRDDRRDERRDDRRDERQYERPRRSDMNDDIPF